MSSREETFLAAARRGLSPTEGDQARVRLATLVALDSALTKEAGGIGVNELGAPGAGLPSAAADFIRRGSRFAVVGALVAAAGAVGYGVGWRAGADDARAFERRSAPRVAMAAPPRAASTSANDDGALAPRAEDPSNRNVDQPDTQVPIASAAGVRAPRVRRGVVPGRPPANTAAPPASAPSTPEDDSGQELRTLRRVERLLRDRNAQYADVLLRELDRVIPHGRFMEERRAATAVAACELAPDARRTQAAAFSAKYPGSVYQKRVEASCASDDARTEGKARGTD